MKALELKIPPPIVGLLCAAAMWGIAQIAPDRLLLQALGLSGSVRMGLVLVLLCLGGAFDVAGLLAFRRAKTTINPLRPNKSSALVSDGIYRITRNPMYVGMLFIQLAWAAYLGNLAVLLMPVLFVAYITRFQIQPEERVLHRLFGADFAAYCTRVRRWL
jgi:protein-S-isoprenylcysteine O-methyltransferase Ste14